MLDPRVRMMAVLWVGFGSILFDSLLPLLGLLLLCSIPTLVHPRLRERMIIILTSMFIVVWGTFISQGLFYSQLPREVFVSVGGIPLYKEGMLHGLQQSLRFISVILAGVSFSLYTPPSLIFRGLISLQIPFPLALMAMTALRSIHIIGSEIYTIRQARAFRGREIWKRNPVDWIRQELMMFKPIVIRAYRRSLHISEALQVRGFSPAAPRTQYRPLSMNIRDWVVLFFLVVSLWGIIFARTTLWLYTMDLYYHPSLRNLYEWTRNWM